MFGMLSLFSIAFYFTIYLYMYLKFYAWASLPLKFHNVFFHSNNKWLILVDFKRGYRRAIFGKSLDKHKFFVNEGVVFHKYAFTYLYKLFGFWWLSNLTVTCVEFYYMMLHSQYYWSPFYHYISERRSEILKLLGNYKFTSYLITLIYSYSFTILLLLISVVIVSYYEVSVFHLFWLRLGLILFLLLSYIFYRCIRLIVAGGISLLEIAYFIFKYSLIILDKIPIILDRFFCFWLNLWVFKVLFSSVFWIVCLKF